MLDLSQPAFTSFEQLESVRESWRTLAATTGFAPDQDWDWQRAVWEQFRTGRRLHVSVASDGGLIKGIAPLVIERDRRKGVQVDVLKPLALLHQLRGTPLISNIEDAERLLEIAFRSLQDGGCRWHLMFMMVERGSPRGRAFENVLRRARYRFHVLDAPPAPFMRIEGGWDQQLARFDAKFRSELRTREKKLRAQGQLELRFFDGPRDFREGLRLVEEIEASSWKSNEGLPITDPVHWDFYRAFAEAAASRGRLCLPILHLDGRAVAFDYGVWADRTYYLLQTSYVAALKDYYPGSVLRKLVVEHMYGRGAREIDFGAGSHIWKSKWAGSQQREFQTYVVFGDNLKGRWLHAASKLAAFARSLRS